MDEFCVSFGFLDFKGILVMYIIYMNFFNKNYSERKNSKLGGFVLLYVYDFFLFN